MQFQKTLVQILDELGISPYELAKRMDSDYRWIVEITSNQEWKPKLDTIFRICYALQFDVETFLYRAEFGIDFRNVVTSKVGNFSYFQDWDILSQAHLILETRPSHIAKTLRTYRHETGLTQKELSRITLFSVNSISLRESMRYQNFPTITTLQLYCSAFKISLATLVSRIFTFTNWELPTNRYSPKMIGSCLQQAKPTM
ncbi:hypothetical protein SDC9_86696 [bioreactor metagenome]|uniref:HTH cro/C1-type domain-containing protein n=1 Tax=bioreactor metagenome TaxID=1076179 RepID=A0A644ZIA3_9ZZZZ